ncbi:MAG: B12-binding domain-containing radical SAM protein, partial [Chloroflexota bacterium]
MAEPSVDITVIAQGEETFGEIVARLSRGERSMQGVAGCAFRIGDEIVINPPRPLRDMNNLPPHDYTLIPVERYFALKRGKRQLDYISSQGCRFRCTFCADPYVYHRGWVGLAPERMGREIEVLVRRYGVHEVAFQDETFFTSRARVEAIADEFIRRRLEIVWTGTLRADQGHRLDDHLLAKCVRSGLRRVMVGVESGSQEMLNRIKKDITLEQVWETAEKCLRHKIGVIYNIIVGFPGESDESVAASLDVAKRLRAMSPDFEVAIFFYKPYPGNPIADDLLRQGYRFPQTLEEWAEFDYIAGRSEWVTEEKWRLVENFKFYQRLAWGHNHNPL